MPDPVTPQTDTPPVGDQGGEDGGKQGEDTPKTFTQEQLDKILQDRLTKQDQKAQKEIEKARTEAKAEAERLAQLSAEEKQKELSKKQLEANQAKETDLIIRENKLTAREKFAELKIPETLVDYVVDKDIEKMEQNIEKFHNEWTNAISEEVKKQLAGNPPKAIGDNSTKGKDVKIVTSL